MKAGHILALCVISGAAGAQIAGQSPWKAIQYRNVAQGNQSRIQEARTDIITNAQQWQQLYSQMAGDPKPGFTPAPVLADFNRQDLIVVHTGKKFTSGHGVYISMIRQERATEVAVDVVIIQPTANSQVQRLTNSPYVVTVVEKQRVPYTFRSTFAYTTTTYPGGNPGHGQCRCTCGGCCCRSNSGFNPGNQNNSAMGGEICPPIQQTRSGGE